VESRVCILRSQENMTKYAEWNQLSNISRSVRMSASVPTLWYHASTRALGVYYRAEEERLNRTTCSSTSTCVLHSLPVRVASLEGKFMASEYKKRKRTFTFPPPQWMPHGTVGIY
jgi:hypothetical protein